MPAALSPAILLTLGIILLALGLFVWNRLRVDVVGLVVMTLLIVTGLVTPQDGISGFANEATVTVALMLILSTGLLRTGVIDAASRWTAQLAGASELRLLLVMLAIVVPLSAFINNTAAVAIMLPIVLGLSRDMGVAPSRVLIPLSFGSQMGGTLTLVGTSTNLLVAGLVLDLGLERIGLFDITPPALVLVSVGVVYILVVGRWLAPARPASQDLLQTYELRDYLTGLIVEDDSPLVGRSLRESRFGQQHGLQVIRIEREEEIVTFPRGGTVLHAGDLLLVKGKIPDIALIEETDHLRISGSAPDLAVGSGEGGAVHLAEVIVPPRSYVIGQTLKDLDFRVRYGVTAIAVQRQGLPIHQPIGKIELDPGDMLLVQGETSALHRLHEEGELALLGAVDLPAKRTRKRRLAVGIMAGVVLLPALGITTILVSALIGTAAMLLTGCLKPDEAYSEMDWSVVVLLGSILPLGIAMQNSGAAQLLAGGVIAVTEPIGPRGALAALYLVTSALANVISAGAAAVILVPIAVSAAVGLDVSPLPLVVAIMFAASQSFLTPYGDQANAFVYGPGGYRFVDFMRIGAPLNLLLLVVATFVIPVFFPFGER